MLRCSSRALCLCSSSDGISEDIRGLEVSSVIWYAAPAIAVLVALRRTPRGAERTLLRVAAKHPDALLDVAG